MDSKNNQNNNQIEEIIYQTLNKDLPDKRVLSAAKQTMAIPNKRLLYWFYGLGSSAAAMFVASLFLLFKKDNLSYSGGLSNITTERLISEQRIFSVLVTLAVILTMLAVIFLVGYKIKSRKN